MADPRGSDSTDRARVDKANATAAELMHVMARLEKDLPLAGRSQLPWLDTHADDVRALVTHGGVDRFAEISGIKRSTVLRWLRQSEHGHRAIVPENQTGQVTYVTDSAGEYWRGVSEGLERALRIVCGREDR